MTGKWKKSIHYALKGIKHLGDEKYMDFFLERENDPFLLEFAHNQSRLSDRKALLIPETGKGWGFFAEFRAMLAVDQQIVPGKSRMLNQLQMAG